MENICDKGRMVIVLVCLSMLLHACGSTGFTIPENENTLHGITGTIINSADKSPAGGITVAVGGTSKMTKTNANGDFSFTGVPSGNYSIIAFVDGKTILDKKVQVLPNTEPNVQLTIPASKLFNRNQLQNRSDTLNYLMQEIERLKSELTQQTERNLSFRRILELKQDEEYRLFKDIFIGEQENVIIMNPEILQFNRKSNKLVVSADELVVIENRYLGYKVYLLIKSFELVETSIGYRMEYDVVPVFEELNSVQNSVRSQWAENRKRSFEGSLRHFFASLAVGRTLSEGYTISSGSYLVDSNTLGSTYSEVQDIAIEPETLLRRLPGHIREVISDRELKVIYEVEQAARKHDFAGVSPLENQTSWLRLKGDNSIRITPFGTTLDNNYDIAGYWKTTPVAEMLPITYRPNMKR